MKISETEIRKHKKDMNLITLTEKYSTNPAIKNKMALNRYLATVASVLYKYTVVSFLFKLA